MTTVNLASRGVWGNAWTKPLMGLVLLGLLGLGVKAIWFDQGGFLVPVNEVPVGANLAMEKWRVVHASLGSIGGNYLVSGSRPSGYAVEALEPDHLVSKTSVGKFAPASMARVVITNKTQLGSGVRVGASVSIWSSQKLGQGLLDTPKRLVDHAVVGKVIKGTGMFASQSQQVEVLVDPALTAQLLQAVASDSPVFLVAQE